MTRFSTTRSGGKPPDDPATFSQDVQLSNVAARVPERVGRGVFSTGVLVLQTPTEFVLDFVQRLTRPHHREVVLQFIGSRRKKG